MSTDVYETGRYWVDNPDWFIHNSPRKVRLCRRPLWKFLDLRLDRCAPVRLLDIGGGAGLVGKGVTDDLAAHGIDVDVWALDLSQEAIDRQAQENPRLSRGFAEDICATSIGYKAVELSLAVDVVEHTRDPKQALREIRRISRYAILKVPIEHSVVQRVWDVVTGGEGRRKALREHFGHEYEFTLRQVREMVRECCGVVELEFLANDHEMHKKKDDTRASRWMHRWACLLFQVSPTLTAWLCGDSVVMLVRCSGPGMSQIAWESVRGPKTRIGEPWVNEP